MSALPIRRFPVLRSERERRAEGNMKPAYVPWDFIAPHEKQAQANHYQTLEKLAQRGGLSWMEMLAVVMGLDFRRINPKANHRAHVLGLLAKWMAAQAIEARRAETQSGSVHESAVGETDAPETPLITPLPSGSIER